MANLRQYCFPICAFTPTGGGGNLNVVVATSPGSGSWDSYHGGGATSDDWIGVIFPPSNCDQLVFVEGSAFADGGWFTAEPTIEYTTNGTSWTAVSGQSCSPSYEANGSTPLQSYTFSFTAVDCIGLRVRGDPGGGASFFSANNLQPQGTLLDDLRAGTGVTRISAFTATGGGQPLSVINDGTTGDWDSSTTADAWDSYHGGGSETDDWVGYTFSVDYEFTGALFVEGGLYTDGGGFASAPTIEVRVSGVWTTVSGLSLLRDRGRDQGVGGDPLTTYNTSHPGHMRNLYSFTAITGDGIRVRGTPGGTSFFISCTELIPLGVEAGGQETPVGRADETDTSLALSDLKIKAMGLSVESDVAQTLSGRKFGTVALGVESDAALALVGRKIETVGLSLETDVALALAGQKVEAMGLSTETDSASALTGSKVSSVGQATETDTAFALNPDNTDSVGMSVEDDVSVSRPAVKVGAVGLSAGTDVALALSAQKIADYASALETSSALALSGLRVKTVGTAVETDVAVARTALKIETVALSTENDVSVALTSQKQLNVEASVETDQALALIGKKVRAVSVSVENDEAIPLRGPSFVGLCLETDIAFALMGQVIKNFKRGTIGSSAKSLVTIVSSTVNLTRSGSVTSSSKKL